MNNAPVAARVRANGLSPLELATHVLFGADDRTVLPAAERDVSARQALERSVLEALRRPPCLVTFSGGRDSSAMLGLAARVARQEGLAAPIPLTGIYHSAPAAEEHTWQELVIEHIGAHDWLRREYGDELDLVGPVATGLMRREGLPYPFNLHLLEPLIGEARGGSLITGVGGDQVLHPAGGFRNVLAGRVRPSARDLAWVAVGLSPRPLRRRVLRGRLKLGFSWMRPDANAQLSRATLEAELRQPVRWDRQLLNVWGSRTMQENVRRIGGLALEHDVAIRHPFAEAGFVRALAREGGRFGFPSRTAAMELLFANIMPPELNRRSTKATFHDVVFNNDTRAFVASLDEQRLAYALAVLDLDELVDPQALLTEWRGAEPNPNSFLLLQACWLALTQ